MGRKRRIHIPNSVVHVVLKCHNSASLLWADSDKELYLEKLTLGCEKYGYRVLSFSVQDNHIHLLLITPEEIIGKTLSEFMHYVNTLFSHEFNRRHNRSGTVWNGRYYAGGWIRVEKAFWMIMLLVWYVERNSWKRKHNRIRPERYRWCSWYYVRNGKEGPVRSELKYLIEKFFPEAKSYEEAVAKFEVLLGKDKPEWEEELEGRVYLWMDSEGHRMVEVQLRDLLKEHRKKLTQEGVRSWKVEVEYYSLLVLPVLRAA